jgi:ketosteroid isomerase-like protein
MRKEIMRKGLWVGLAVLVGVASTAAPVPASPPPPPVADARSEVRAREQAFARTMADRDHVAFVSFLAEETVFFGGAAPLRGKKAVAEAWKKFYEGPKAPFSWEPDAAEVLESGGLAMTSGPVFDPAGKRVGTFNSIWRREPDGQWRIVFDKGCPSCDCR